MLIRTKLQRPRLSQNLVRRPHLLRRLDRGLECKLTLVSAQAGAGKTTLLSQWLAEYPGPSAWLSLDEHDTDLLTFVQYLCAALQMTAPDMCTQTLALIHAPVSAPPRVLLASFVNELDATFGVGWLPADNDADEAGFVLVLDDYHAITIPAIHTFVAGLIDYLPRNVHLVLSTRTDPPLPLVARRTGQEMIELRTADLRFTPAEAGALLRLTVGRDVDTEIVAHLADKMDGWAVGLRLAGLALGMGPDAGGFDVERGSESGGTGGVALMEYLVNEVLARQPVTRLNFLLRTSVVDRFNADLCAALLQPDSDLPDPSRRPTPESAHVILRELSAANLFLVQLDAEGQWFRYHHVFRDLLRYRLELQCAQDTVKELHYRASRWFEAHSQVEEALQHAFATGDVDYAASILSRQRYALINLNRWQLLDRYLHRFPRGYVQHRPELLMLKIWRLHHQGHGEQLPEALHELEACLKVSDLPTELLQHLQGEISVLHSWLSYFRADVERTIAQAQFALANTAEELWIARVLARLTLAGARHMQGDASGAYDVLYQGFDQEFVQDEVFRATLLMSVCFMDWLGADLPRLTQTATQCLTYCNEPCSVEIRNYALHHLACADYQRNDLTAAEQHFAAVVRQPYLNYSRAFTHAAIGLSLTYQAQGREQEARTVIEHAENHLSETGNTPLLAEIRAYHAELALRQNRLTVAEQWLNQFADLPPLTAMPAFFRAEMTPVKIWLARNTPGSRRQAATRLAVLAEYTMRTHNTIAAIEVLALQALLVAADGDERTAHELAGQALALGQSGGVVRLFADLGAPMARLLATIDHGPLAPEYLGQVRAAFAACARNGHQQVARPIDPLTHRETEVLSLLARRLTNKEMADTLGLSPDTVKTHTLNIYAKLDVHGRRDAVKKAQELGLVYAV